MYICYEGATLNALDDINHGTVSDVLLKRADKSSHFQSAVSWELSMEMYIEFWTIADVELWTVTDEYDSRF